MEFQLLHEWPKNPNDAVKIQLQFKSRVTLQSEGIIPKLVTAVDTAFNEKTNRLYAAAVTLKYPELENVERAVAEMEAEFPYIPALLAFREGPVILKALGRLDIKPDVIIYPGHGIAHPRTFGMACHLGLLTDIPAIGCAKKCLVGDFRPPSGEKGSCSSLFVSNIEVGFVYRTKTAVKPMYITPGYKCSIREAIDVAVGCLTQYRMPEPLRLAHLFANKYKNSAARKIASKKDRTSEEKIEAERV